MSFDAVADLPLGNAGFSCIRQCNQIYVDKTALIYALCRRKSSSVFLARPRRFGKSLLVSTLESLFKDGLRDFQGLAIEKLWTDTTYPVVHLDFSAARDFQDFEGFKKLFELMLLRRFCTAGFVFDSESPDGVIGQLDSWMWALPNVSLVILIDEYDAPLTATLHEPQLFALVQSLINRFFLTIKSCSASLRFFFMTGVTKLSNAGIFSGFNILEDISSDAEFGTLLGYTEDEIKENFGPRLERAAGALGLTQEALLEGLRTNYGGFCFDEDASTRVYCPWSVLNFLNDPDKTFQNYWFASGGHPSLLVDLLRGNPLENPAVFDNPMLLESHVLAATQQNGAFSLPALLTQAGYFTIKDVPTEGYVTLGYPNEEVRSSFARLYAGELLRGADRSRIEIVNLKRALEEGDVEAAVRILNLVFASIDAARHPVTDEAACRGFLQVLLIGAAMLPRVAVHTTHGESVLELEAGRTCWVFDIKFARRENEADALLSEGLQQMHSREYGKTAHGLTLVRAVLVFDGAARAFTRFALCDGPEGQTGN